MVTNGPAAGSRCARHAAQGLRRVDPLQAVAVERPRPGIGEGRVGDDSGKGEGERAY